MQTEALAVAAAAALAGCAPPSNLTLPGPDEVEAYYESDAGLSAEINGNVATITVAQDAQQIRRGGSLWAKVGPYVFLFTEETQALFADYPGLAGVRVVTRVGDAEVANALLARDELTDVLWRRGLNVAGRARRDGSTRVTLLEELVRWGESHTEFEYNSRFVRR
jgi:hypothetical protein